MSAAPIHKIDVLPWQRYTSAKRVLLRLWPFQEFGREAEQGVEL